MFNPFTANDQAFIEKMMSQGATYTEACDLLDDQNLELEIEARDEELMEVELC